MGCIGERDLRRFRKLLLHRKRVTRIKRYDPVRLSLEEQLMAGKNGSITQLEEDRTFNPDDAGSKPAGPTKNILIVKKCNKCGNPMYIHITDAPDPIFTGCEPCVVDLRLEKVNDHEIVIKGRRSSHQVRCSQCKTRKHLISSFKDVDHATSKG